MFVLSRDSRLDEQAHCLGHRAGNFVLLSKQLVHLGCLIAASNEIAVCVWLGAGTVITSWLRSGARFVVFVVVTLGSDLHRSRGMKRVPGYWAMSPRGVFGPVVPLFATDAAPMSGMSGRVAGVAYRMLTVHVPPEASGLAVKQVVPVMLYSPPVLRVSESAVMDRLLPAGPDFGNVRTEDFTESITRLSVR